jgi:hypothetical protein
MLNTQDTKVMLEAGYSLAEIATIDYCPCGNGEIGTYFGGVCTECSEENYQD